MMISLMPNPPLYSSQKDTVARVTYHSFKRLRVYIGNWEINAFMTRIARPSRAIRHSYSEVSWTSCTPKPWLAFEVTRSSWSSRTWLLVPASMEIFPFFHTFCRSNHHEISDAGGSLDAASRPSRATHGGRLWREVPQEIDSGWLWIFLALR